MTIDEKCLTNFSHRQASTWWRVEQGLRQAAVLRPSQPARLGDRLHRGPHGGRQDGGRARAGHDAAGEGQLLDGRLEDGLQAGVVDAGTQSNGKCAVAQNLGQDLELNSLKSLSQSWL